MLQFRAGFTWTNQKKLPPRSATVWLIGVYLKKLKACAANNWIKGLVMVLKALHSS